MTSQVLTKVLATGTFTFSDLLVTLKVTMKKCFVQNLKTNQKVGKSFKSTVSKLKKFTKVIKHGKLSLKQCILSSRSNVTSLLVILHMKMQKTNCRILSRKLISEQLTLISLDVMILQLISWKNIRTEK